jgi:hypothetical protein
MSLQNYFNSNSLLFFRLISAILICNILYNISVLHNRIFILLSIVCFSFSQKYSTTESGEDRMFVVLKILTINFVWVSFCSKILFYLKADMNFWSSMSYEKCKTDFCSNKLMWSQNKSHFKWTVYYYYFFCDIAALFICSLFWCW